MNEESRRHRRGEVEHVIRDETAALIKGKTLVAFNLDGTLIENFLMLDGDKLVPAMPYSEIRVLPRRREHLRELSDHGDRGLAVITNQGHHTDDEVNEKMAIAERTLGLSDLRFRHPRWPTFHYEMHHPAASVELWRGEPTYGGAKRRKPGSGMLLEAMDLHHAEPAQTLYVGDLDVDEQAAANAGVDFMWAWAFFGDAPPPTAAHATSIDERTWTR